MTQRRSLPFLRDFLTAEDKEGVFNADHFPLWYKRAAEQVPGTFVYSIPFSTGRVRAINLYLTGRTATRSTRKALRDRRNYWPIIFRRSKVNVPSESTTRPIFNMSWKLKNCSELHVILFINRQTDRQPRDLLGQGSPLSVEQAAWILLVVAATYSKHFGISSASPEHSEGYVLWILPLSSPPSPLSCSPMFSLLEAGGSIQLHSSGHLPPSHS